jgi:hypothetical protein
LFIPSNNTALQPTQQIVNVIHIPENAEELRIYITSKDGHSAILPRTLELFEVKIDEPKSQQPS